MNRLIKPFGNILHWLMIGAAAMIVVGISWLGWR